MTVLIRVAMAGMLIVSATIASAQEPKPAAADNMTVYRVLAADTLQAFKSHDIPATRKKAKELEGAWDTREKALQKTSPELWGQIDKAMDVFIKPLQDKSPDPAKVQIAYDMFIAKLDLAASSTRSHE